MKLSYWKAIVEAEKAEACGDREMALRLYKAACDSASTFGNHFVCMEHVKRLSRLVKPERAPHRFGAR